MTRRRFSHEFKREAVQLVMVRGVSVAQAARDIDVHATVLRRWIKQYGNDPAGAFPGKGQMTPADDELRRLRREVAKLKGARDILKKPRPTSQRTRRDVRLHCEAPGDLAGQLDVRGARCLAERLPCLVDAAAQGTGQKPRARARSPGHGPEAMRSSLNASGHVSCFRIALTAPAASGATCSRKALPAACIASNG